MLNLALGLVPGSFNSALLMLISMALISCGLLTYEVMVTWSKDHTEAVLPVDLYVDMY